MTGPDQYIVWGLIVSIIGGLAGAWALWHDARAVERQKRQAAEKSEKHA